jgi:N-acetylglucosaminyl-diphospho-decaprenol L-rhamnosyltransferase
VTDLSIITVTYQSAAKIGAFLEAAHLAAPSAEIVVVDNASTDETRQLVQAADARVQLVSVTENLGFGRACNLGSKNARGTWLLFANPDVQLRAVSIPTSIRGQGFGLGAGLMTTGSRDVGVPGVRAETTQAEDWLQEVWSLFVPRPLMRHFVGRRRPIGWPIGGMFLAHHDEYKATGGFDPRYFLFFEDRDLGLRYRREGLPVHVVAGLEGTHWVGSSSANIESWHRGAWSIISWLEYTAVWRGADQAASTAAHVLRVLGGIARLASRPALPDRVRSKAHSAGLTAHFIMNFDEFLPGDPQTYYPCARVAVAAAKDLKVV